MYGIVVQFNLIVGILFLVRLFPQKFEIKEDKQTFFFRLSRSLKSRLVALVTLRCIEEEWNERYEKTI